MFPHYTSILSLTIFYRANISALEELAEMVNPEAPITAEGEAGAASPAAGNTYKTALIVGTLHSL